ncbi:ATP-binding protein [Massilia violaceinigra]|uniref:ATP-binding protein n=1 Tax=Massilia violaceinigra TaxID=2045208 RepID=A0ABY4A8T1_9BURK|nr:AAA family ATPase [Massilia violaceinigra]UOD31187.1 ATP-binding protein [Massilia violaceinigra]
MKQNVEIMAYIFADARGTMRAMRFIDGIGVERSLSGFDIVSTPVTLPAQFFSANVAHVAAMVGTNASGKSTALQDICRILTGQRPVAAHHALVIRSDQGVHQLCSQADLVTLDGQAIDDEHPGGNANLNVVFYAGGYDPMGRTRELAPRSTGVEFRDISDQFIYSGDASHDVASRLFYLEHLVRTKDTSLFLQADGKHRRTVSFEVGIGYDRDTAARDFLEFALTFSKDQTQVTNLVKLLGIEPEQLADFFHAIDTRMILTDPGTHFLNDQSNYFERLRAYVNASQADDIVIFPFGFAMAIGRIVELLHAQPDAARWTEQLPRFDTDFAGVVDQLLGTRFRSDMHMLEFTAARVKGMSADNMSISITLGNEPSMQAPIKRIIQVLLRLRRQDFDVSLRFAGISEGQRTLLTFYSRLFHQAAKEQPGATSPVGTTLLLVDEHEHGLHPEWQRRYLHELITLLGKPPFASQRYQIILSTHSPFLVSDLPGTHVNKLGSNSDNATPTLAANLLELLLSPLFLENSTGEFSRIKIVDLLDAIEQARTENDLGTAARLLPLLGDDLIRNYCTIRVKEKRRHLLMARP